VDPMAALVCPSDVQLLHHFVATGEAASLLYRRLWQCAGGQIDVAISGPAPLRCLPAVSRVLTRLTPRPPRRDVRALTPGPVRRANEHGRVVLERSGRRRPRIEA
jgi:hypothetical protein